MTESIGPHASVHRLEEPLMFNCHLVVKIILYSRYGQQWMAHFKHNSCLFTGLWAFLYRRQQLIQNNQTGLQKHSKFYFGLFPLSPSGLMIVPRIKSKHIKASFTYCAAEIFNKLLVQYLYMFVIAVEVCTDLEFFSEGNMYANMNKHLSQISFSPTSLHYKRSSPITNS